MEVKHAYQVSWWYKKPISRYRALPVHHWTSRLFDKAYTVTFVTVATRETKKKNKQKKKQAAQMSQYKMSSFLKGDRGDYAFAFCHPLILSKRKTNINDPKQKKSVNKIPFKNTHTSTDGCIFRGQTINWLRSFNLLPLWPPAQLILINSPLRASTL